MIKYIVVMYYIPTDACFASAYDTKNEALRFVSDNYFLDKKYHEEKDWFYKIIEVKVE